MTEQAFRETFNNALATRYKAERAGVINGIEYCACEAPYRMPTALCPRCLPHRRKCVHGNLFWCGHCGTVEP